MKNNSISKKEIESLSQMIKDGIVEVTETEVRLTEIGVDFL